MQERLKLIDLILGTIDVDDLPPAGPDWPEIERRAAEARANPQSGMTLEELEARLRTIRK